MGDGGGGIIKRGGEKRGMERRVVWEKGVGSVREAGRKGMERRG